MSTINSSFDLLADLGHSDKSQDLTAWVPSLNLSVPKYTNALSGVSLERVFFGFCLIVISSVSMYDVYWSFKTQ